MEKVYVPKDPHEKAMQRALIQYRDPKNYELVAEALKVAGRQDLIGYDKHCLIRPRRKKGEEQGDGGTIEYTGRGRLPAGRKRQSETYIKRKADFCEVAVISGASSGIGRELVKIIDRRCKVLDEIWVIGRRRDRLEKLQFHLNHPLRIIDMDLSLTENLKKLQELFEKRNPGSSSWPPAPALGNTDFAVTLIQRTLWI